MEVKHRYYLLLLLLFLVGCMANSQFTARKNVKVNKDDFNNTITLLGVEEKFKYDKGYNLNYHLIRTIIEVDQDTLQNQLYIKHRYGGSDWHLYDRASFTGGQEAEIYEISSDVKSCTAGNCEYEEVLGITLPMKYLKMNKNGFPIKIYGRSGDTFIVNVTPNQIIKQIDKINQVR